MTHKEQYHIYLASEAWQIKRREALSRAHYCCAACGEKRNLEVHHLTYARIFNEEPGDLMVLCGEHHDQIERLISKGAISRVGWADDLASQTIKLLRPIFFATIPKAPKKKKNNFDPNNPKWRRKMYRRVRHASGFRAAALLTDTEWQDWLWYRFKTYCVNKQIIAEIAGLARADFLREQSALPPVSKDDTTEVRLDTRTMASFASPKGGFNREQMALLGVPWPPPKKWLKKQHGRIITMGMLEQLKSMRKRFNGKGVL